MIVCKLTNKKAETGQQPPPKTKANYDRQTKCKVASTQREIKKFIMIYRQSKKKPFKFSLPKFKIRFKTNLTLITFLKFDVFQSKLGF